MNETSHVSIKDFVDGNTETGFLTPFTILDFWVVNFTVVYHARKGDYQVKT